MEFKFLLPAKVVMGPDLRERTGEYLRELGMAHVLIVTDAGVKAAGLLNGVYASLNEWEIAFDEISGHAEIKGKFTHFAFKRLILNGFSNRAHSL